MKKLFLFITLFVGCISFSVANNEPENFFGGFLAKAIDNDEVKLDYSSDKFCDMSPITQLRNGLFFLPNTEEPYSGENLCIYQKNGQYFNQGTIKNGLREGKWTYWFENGQKQFELYVNNNDINGIATMWLENGHKISEMSFKDNQFDGKVIVWHENGQKGIESNYKNDKRDGMEFAWYESGQLKYVHNYKNGNFDGKWTEWSRDGDIVSEKTYSNFNLGEANIAYTKLIKETVQSNWNFFLGAEKGWSCNVIIEQDDEGYVESVLVSSCNPEDYYQNSSKYIPFENSIERAVYKSSPLPQPSEDAVFSNYLMFTFEVE